MEEATASSLDNILPPPWSRVTVSPERIALQSELEKELSPHHLLWQLPLEVIARSAGSDDILIVTETLGYVQVHLTWSGQSENAPWPRAIAYSSLESWCTAATENF